MSLIIQGTDYKISSVGVGSLYDVELIYTNTKNKKNPTKTYYGCSFKSVLQRISKFRLEQGHPDPFTDVRDYMTSLMQEEKELIDEIIDKIPKDLQAEV